MIHLTHTIIFVLLIFFGAHGQSNRQPQNEKPNTASVSGKITINGDPAAGVQVVLIAQGSNDPSARTTTDTDGRYKLESLPSGYYQVNAMSPGYVAQSQGPSLQEEITLQEGKKLEGIDFSLVKGGVITGRVTDPDENPLTGLVPDIKKIDEKGQPVAYTLPLISEFDTDDRGIYRIYGLPAGRYIIGFGFDKGATKSYEQTQQSGTVQYSLMFYPGVTDQSQAKVIEVTPGNEITGVDLQFSTKENVFKMTGVMVDAKTSLPAANVIFAYGKMTNGAVEFVEVATKTDTKGKFKVEDLQPGKYAIKVIDEERAVYSDMTEVDLTNGDVEGIEIKVHAASVISGVVVPDGISDEDLNAALQDIVLYTKTIDQSERFFDSDTRINEDRSFELREVRPGKVILNFGHSPAGKSSLWIEYIEIPNVGRVFGANVTSADDPELKSAVGPIEITEGQNLSGVRVVVSAATGIISGQVKFEGGQLPSTGHIETRAVLAKPNDQSGGAYASVVVDPDGRFVIKGVAPGDYRLYVYVSSGIEQVTESGVKQLVTKSIGEGDQSVSVQNGTTTQVTVTVKLTTPGKP